MDYHTQKELAPVQLAFQVFHFFLTHLENVQLVLNFNIQFFAVHEINLHERTFDRSSMYFWGASFGIDRRRSHELEAIVYIMNQ